MVFFTCDGCGEALKKNQVDKHKFRCRSATYSCIDCNAVFSSVDYKDHIKCISEDQKYGGKNFVQKENKGEVKQNKWIEQVERAIAKVKEPAVKGVLQQILGFGNIPRKQAKFVNFLMNSIRIRDRNLCVKAWDCIAEEASKMQEEENKQKEDEKKEKEEVKKEEITEDQTSSADAIELTANGKHNEGNNGTCANSDFKWKKAIKRALKEEGGEMKVKKLRKSIIGEYLENRLDTEDSSTVRELFDSKLSSSGVVVEGKVARLSWDYD